MTLQKTKYSLAAEFGLPDFPATAMITGFAGEHPAIPPIDADYVFEFQKLRDFFAFWNSGFNALKIKGDPSTGKTSLCEQWHARLRWPIFKVPCSRSTEASSLIGGMLPIEDGTLKWFDGPVLMAAREGYSVLLDEYNTLDPDQATGLNMLLEGYSITIPQTGEVVTPKPGFRVFGTENDVQSRLAVTGRNVQDAANDDRWMIMRVNYLPAAEEEKVIFKALINAKAPDGVARQTAEVLVKLANDIRTAYRKEEVAIDKPISTRALKRWAVLTWRFKQVLAEEGGPMVYALHRAVDMSPDMSACVEEKVKAKVGL